MPYQYGRITELAKRLRELRELRAQRIRQQLFYRDFSKGLKPAPRDPNAPGTIGAQSGVGLRAPSPLPVSAGTAYNQALQLPPVGEGLDLAGAYRAAFLRDPQAAMEFMPKGLELMTARPEAKYPEYQELQLGLYQKPFKGQPGRWEVKPPEKEAKQDEWGETEPFNIGGKKIFAKFNKSKQKWITQFGEDLPANAQAWDAQYGMTGSDAGDLTGIQRTAPGEYNPEALKGLSAADAAVVKGLVEYKIQLPSGFALRAPYWQKILGAAVRYDPSFDAAQYRVRQKARENFTSGNYSKTIVSVNTLISHMDHLRKAGEALENSGFQPGNTVRNFLRVKFGKPEVVKFEAARNAVAGEAAAVFKATGATDVEIKAWTERVNSSQSPEQLHGFVEQMWDLLIPRLGYLSEQYRAAIGKPKDFYFLHDKARDIARKHGIDPDSIDPIDAGMEGGAAEAVGLDENMEISVPGQSGKMSLKQIKQTYYSHLSWDEYIAKMKSVGAIP